MSAAKSIARIIAHRNTTQPPPQADPACAFGLLVKQDLADIRKDLEDLKATARWLLYLMAGSIITAIIQAVTTWRAP